MPSVEVNELNNLIYNGDMEKSDGSPILLVEIVSVALTLWDVETLDIINGRNDQDVLNDNNVVITDGQIVWEVQSLDNPIIGTLEPGGLQAHDFVFNIVYDVDKRLVHDGQIMVRNIALIPAAP